MKNHENIKTVIKSKIVLKQKTWFRDGTTITKWFSETDGKPKNTHIGFSPINKKEQK